MSKKKSHVVRVSDTTLEKLNQLRKSDDKSLDQVVSRLGNEGEQKINLNSLHEAWELSGQSSNDEPVADSIVNILVRDIGLEKVIQLLAKNVNLESDCPWCGVPLDQHTERDIGCMDGVTVLILLSNAGD
jgi:hypothetical protein